MSCLGNGNLDNAVDRHLPGVWYRRVGGFSALPAPAGTYYPWADPYGYFNLQWDPVTSVGRGAGLVAAGYELWYAITTRSKCGEPPRAADFHYLKTVTDTRAQVDAAEIGYWDCYHTGAIFALRPVFPATGGGERLTTTFLSMNGSCFSCGFPVTVYDLAARALGRGVVEVSWRTSLEDGVARFDVQRASAQDGPFETVGTIDAKGEPASYAFFDRPPRVRHPGDAALFYRVLSSDLSNGSQTFGPVLVEADVPRVTTAN